MLLKKLRKTTPTIIPIRAYFLNALFFLLSKNIIATNNTAQSIPVLWVVKKTAIIHKIAAPYFKEALILSQETRNIKRTNPTKLQAILSSYIPTAIPVNPIRPFA